MSDKDANAKRSAEEHRQYDDLLMRYSQAVAAELVAKTTGLDPVQRDRMIGQWTSDASGAIAQLTGAASMEVLANAIAAAGSDAAKAQAFVNLEGSLAIQRIRWQVGREAMTQIALGEALQPQSGQSRRGQARPDTIARLRQLLNSITAVNVEAPRLPSWTMPDRSDATAAQRQAEEWRRRQERDAYIAEFMRLAGTGPILDSDGNLITGDLRKRIGANAMLQLAEALRASGIEPSTIRALLGWNDTRTDVGNQINAGVLADETFQVLQLLDASTSGGSPQQWARAMAQVIRRGADQVHTWRGGQIPEGGGGGVGGWFYENFWAKRDVGLATGSDLIGYNVETGQEANRTGALAAEDARIDAFEKEAGVAVAALNAMASATSPADLTADQRKLLTAFGFIGKGAGGLEVFQIPTNGDVNAQLQRDLNLPGASMLDIVSAGAVQKIVIMMAAPQMAAARVGLVLQALGASERAVVVGEFITTALANAALDAAQQKYTIGSVQWDRLILDTVVLNTVLPLAGQLTGAVSGSLAGQIAKNPETKKAIEVVLAQSLGLSSDTVLLTYWQGKVSGTGMTYEDFLANAFNGVVMRAAPLYGNVLGKPVTAALKAAFKPVRSFWEAVRGITPEFRAELLGSQHTPEQIAAYLESQRFKTQQQQFKDAADRLTSVLGEDYLKKNLADPDLIAKVTEAAETGKIGFPDLKAVFGQTPELQALMDGINGHRLKLFDGIIATAQQRARAAVNVEYDARATRLKDALANDAQLKTALAANETDRQTELGKIDEKPKAPGSKNATSDIDRSISSTYLRNELKAVTDEVFRKNRPGADAATSAKAYDVNEYFDIFQVINRMRDQKIDLSGVMLNEPGVGKVSQTDAIAAAGLAADMQDMSPAQRAEFKKNRISQGDPTRMGQLFNLAEQCLARDQTLLNQELAALGQQGRDTTDPDVLTRARDNVYGRRAQELAEMEAALARMDVKSDDYKALAARIEREWAYVKLAGIEAYTNFAGLDIIVNKAQMNDITIRELITGKADLTQNGKVNKGRAEKGEPPILLEQRQAMIDKVLGEIRSQYGKEQLGGALDDQIRFIVDHVNLYFEGHESATQAGTALSKYAERSSLLLKLAGSDMTQGQLKTLDDIAGILVKVRGDPKELNTALAKFGGGSADAGIRKLSALLSETLPGLKGLFDPAMYAPDSAAGGAGVGPRAGAGPGGSSPAVSAAALNGARVRRAAERQQLWMTSGAGAAVNAIAADQASLRLELQRLEQERTDDARLATDYRTQDFATVRQLEDQAKAIEIERRNLVGRDASVVRRDLDNQAANVQAQLTRVKSYKPAGAQASTPYQQWRDRRITAITDQLAANDAAALQYAQLAQTEALLSGGAVTLLPGGPSIGFESVTPGPDTTSEHPEFDKMAKEILKLLEAEGTVPAGPEAPRVTYRNVWSKVPARSEETYVSGDFERLGVKLWDYLHEADFDMSEWKPTKNADGSITYTSAKTGQTVTGRLVTANKVDPVSGQTFKMTRIVVEKPAGMNGSVGANTTGSTGPNVPGGTGTLTIFPNQLLALTPFQGGPTYSGIFGPSGGIYLSAPGTTIDPLKPPMPLFVADPVPLPLGGFVTQPDGTVTFTGLNVSGLGTPTGVSVGPLVNVDPVTGKLIFTDPKAVTGSGSGGNTIGRSPGSLGPTFAFGDDTTFIKDPAGRAVDTSSSTSNGSAVGFVIRNLTDVPNVALSRSAPADTRWWDFNTVNLDLGTTLGITPPQSVSFSDGSADDGPQVFGGLIHLPGVVQPWNPFQPTSSAVARVLHTLAEFVEPHVGAHLNRAMVSTAAGHEPRGSRPVSPEMTLDAGSAIKAQFVSLGTATGEAFEVSVINDSEHPIALTGDGIVLEAVSKGNQDRARKQFQDAVKARGTKAPVPMVARIDAYCLEYLKPPPAAGTVFRVADAQTQVRHLWMRQVLQAEQRLEQLSRIVPDSDPIPYVHALRQWSLWAKAMKLTPESFAKEFVEHAKKNITAAGRPWTKQIEAQIASLVPHRWQEIAMVLQEAEKVVR